MIDAPGAAPSLPLWRVDRILSDEDGVLVVDKPPHLPVYGGDESLCHSVVDRLGALFEERGERRELSVHQRLDQETSGVLFFVTDKRRDVEFAQAMEQHAIERTYYAVVAPAASGSRGSLPDEKRVELWFHFDGERAQTSSGKPGRAEGSRAKAKRGVTHFRVLRRVGERILIELKLETGRTHQIRASLAHLGFPVLGDKLYGGAPASRLMLHAASISGGPLRGRFEAPVPDVFVGALEGEEEFPSDFASVLADAATLRAPLCSSTEAYRLVNGAGDGLPGLTVDAYGRFAVMNVYAAALLPRAPELALEIARLGFAGVYLKQRVRADLRTQNPEELAPDAPISGERAPETLVVSEFAMMVHIDLHDGLSSGLFVDMRDNRLRARAWARGGRMLNLFCYTSSFGVSAALGGARTTNVDVSAKALQKSRQNFEANGLDPGEHRFFKEDALKFLARSARREEKYDFIVLDPPSFSTTGKGTFSVKSAYGKAACDCFRILARGGRLLCVTNHTKTSPRAFRQMVEAAGTEAGRRIKSLKELKAGLDCPAHPEGPWPSKSLLVEID